MYDSQVKIICIGDVALIIKMNLKTSLKRYNLPVRIEIVSTKYTSTKAYNNNNIFY